MSLLDFPKIGAALSAALLAAAPLAAQTAAPAYQTTREVRDAVIAAQTAVAQNNFAAAGTSLSQAQAAARSDGDRYVIAAARLDVANRTFNQEGQVSAINALISNPATPDAYRAELYYHLARFAYAQQDMTATRDALTRAIERGSTDPRTHIALADIYSRSNAHAQALDLFDRAVQLQTAAGQPVSVDWYRRAIDIAQRANDTTRLQRLGYELLSRYPEGRNWRDIVLLYRGVAGSLSAQQTLDLMRLLFAVNALTGENDYLEYAQLANAAEQPAEIERAVAFARTSNIIDATSTEVLALDRGTTRAAQAVRDAIGRRATSANGQASGADAMDVADDYFGLGEYAQAATLYQAALQKGGIDSDLANLRLGMALALSGQAEPARSALASAGGQQAIIARLWSVYVDARVRGAAPAPAVTPGG